MRGSADRRRPTLPGLLGAVGLLGLALVASPAPVEAGKPTAKAGNNNYFKYVDKQGVIHITNRPRGKQGDWKLYKSIAANRTGAGGAAGEFKVDRGAGKTVTLDSERAHRYDGYIRGAARRYQLPEAFVRAVIHTESRFNANAVSRAGAMGLMQLMPSTAEFLGVTQPFDPRQNIYGGCKLLRLLANRFNGDMVLVAAGYNAGPGAVLKYEGVPPYVETRAYVKSVLRRYYAYERQSQIGGKGVRRGPARNIAG
ncbi:lytic transglycosylase domain-containing protein [Pseudenhygromyxa sp. WMMC2535]|uniref:lytic transglycosylase domain-containing protein n=1 Tax=Pseudenhygromyxa sp. WMMC2535 TaxID=2712867 RepID=UPI0015562C25|nr:lytic transglycosylase domain-containing protein [Pseudenhygromyxa sp. WMMC2535]NVB42640.1 lytic transglycosylase domain-containing protein [Pseudenhygromyxa sp. WMMC2535]